LITLRMRIEFAVAASALKQTIYCYFNRVSFEEVESLTRGDQSGRVKRWSFFKIMKRAGILRMEPFHWKNAGLIGKIFYKKLIPRIFS